MEPFDIWNAPLGDPNNISSGRYTSLSEKVKQFLSFSVSSSFSMYTAFKLLIL